MLRVANWAKMMTPRATIHVTSMELVTGNGPILKTVGALAGRPSGAASAACSEVSGNPAKTSHKNVILISRIGH